MRKCRSRNNPQINVCDQARSWQWNKATKKKWLSTTVKQGILQIMDKDGAAQVISYGDHVERTRGTGAKQSYVCPPLANLSNPKLEVQTYCCGAKQHFPKDDIDDKILVSIVSRNRSGQVQEEASKDGCGDNHPFSPSQQRKQSQAFCKLLVPGKLGQHRYRLQFQKLDHTALFQDIILSPA